MSQYSALQNGYHTDSAPFLGCNPTVINQKTIRPISLESPWITLNGFNLDSIVVCCVPFQLLSSPSERISGKLFCTYRHDSVCVRLVRFIPYYFNDLNRYSLGFRKNANIFPIIITAYLPPLALHVVVTSNTNSSSTRRQPHGTMLYKSLYDKNNWTLLAREKTKGAHKPE